MPDTKVSCEASIVDHWALAEVHFSTSRTRKMTAGLLSASTAGTEDGIECTSFHVARSGPSVESNHDAANGGRGDFGQQAPRRHAHSVVARGPSAHHPPFGVGIRSDDVRQAPCLGIWRENMPRRPFPSGVE
jgi:hypothetical protein